MNINRSVSSSKVNQLKERLRALREMKMAAQGENKMQEKRKAKYDSLLSRMFNKLPKVNHS